MVICVLMKHASPQADEAQAAFDSDKCALIVGQLNSTKECSKQSCVLLEYCRPWHSSNHANLPAILKHNFGEAFTARFPLSFMTIRSSCCSHQLICKGIEAPAKAGQLVPTQVLISLKLVAALAAPNLRVNLRADACPILTLPTQVSTR